MTVLQRALLLVLCTRFTHAHLDMRLLTGLGLTRRSDDEVNVRALGTERSGLLIEHFLDLLVLHLVEHTLQQSLEFILAHDILRHLNEGNLGGLPHVLAGVGQVIRQVHQ